MSPGCAHCYALDLAGRLKRMGQRGYQRDGGKASGPGFAVTLHPDRLLQPLRWRRPRRIFVNSMSDLFHEEVPDRFVAQVFAVMGSASHHVFRMRDYLAGPNFVLEVCAAADELGIELPWAPGQLAYDDLQPYPNVWLGVSIENRRFVHRADLLRDTAAAVRFISAEPLLGPLIGDLTGPGYPGRDHLWMDGYFGDGLDLDRIDWLIVGGESGPDHRPVRPEWVRDLRDSAEHFGAAFFFKQWGGRTPKSAGRELDGRTWDEFPRAREAVPA